MSSASSHTTGIRYKIDIEGVEPTLEGLNTILGQTSRAIGLVSTLDYTFMSFQQVANNFNILSFTRAVIATISLIRQLIGVLKAAEAAQIALNIATAIGEALKGPKGWLTLAAATGVAAVSIHEILRIQREAGSYSRSTGDYEEYRSSIP